MYDALFSEISASNSLGKTAADTHAMRKEQRNAFGDKPRFQAAVVAVVQHLLLERRVQAHQRWVDCLRVERQNLSRRDRLLHHLH